MSKRRAAAALAFLAAGLFVYAAVVEPRWLRLTRTRIHIRALPPQLEGLRIALLSDMHVGEFTTPGLVRRAVLRTMGASPDLIALTGDFAVDADSLRATLAELSNLSAPLGVYAVPGNHDHGEIGIRTWRDGVAEHQGITDLTNRVVVLEREGARLCIAGVDDYEEGEPRLDDLPPPADRDTTILLAHSPDQAERCRRLYDAIDLILSGHTHGGQIRVPFLGALVNPARHRKLYEQGVRRRPWTQVYTSRGIGTTGLPLRFLARPEIAILELTAAPRPPLRRARGGTPAALRL